MNGGQMSDGEFDEYQTELRHQQELDHREHAGKFLLVGCELCLDDFEVALSDLREDG